MVAALYDQEGGVVATSTPTSPSLHIFLLTLFCSFETPPHTVVKVCEQAGRGQAKLDHCFSWYPHNAPLCYLLKKDQSGNATICGKNLITKRLEMSHVLILNYDRDHRPELSRTSKGKSIMIPHDEKPLWQPLLRRPVLLGSLLNNAYILVPCKYPFFIQTDRHCPLLKA